MVFHHLHTLHGYSGNAGQSHATRSRHRKDSTAPTGKDGKVEAPNACEGRGEKGKKNIGDGKASLLGLPRYRAAELDTPDRQDCWRKGKEKSWSAQQSVSWPEYFVPAD